MNARRSALRAAVIALAVALLAVLVGATPAGATGWGGSDPAHNITPVPAFIGSSCDSDPRGSVCRVRLVQALDHARAVLHQAGYALPERFGWLSPREQLLVLINQDRHVEGLAPVVGLNAALDASATAAVADRDDPLPVATLGGAHWSMWAANWAGGEGAYESALASEYDWMYYDGLNADGSSWNLLCTRDTPSFCWKHRHNILARPAPYQQLALGAAGGADGRGAWGFTQLLETVPRAAPVTYVPTVVRTSARTAHHTGGGVLTIGGFGFVRVTDVRIVGAEARVLSATPWTLRIALPPHAPAYGHIIVRTTGGTSSLNYAAEFRYVP